LIACEPISSSASGVARRQSFRALSPASASYSHTRSLLPFQRSCSERLPGGDLAFEFPRRGLHPLAAVVPARRFWIGNTAASSSAPGRLFPVSAGGTPHGTRSACEVVFLRRWPATSRLRSRLSRGKTVAHFQNRLWLASVLIQSGVALGSALSRPWYNSRNKDRPPNPGPQADGWRILYWRWSRKGRCRLTA
jgi:hypothetical protein